MLVLLFADQSFAKAKYPVDLPFLILLRGNPQGYRRHSVARLDRRLPGSRVPTDDHTTPATIIAAITVAVQ
jgi:hypothetical protein